MAKKVINNFVESKNKAPVMERTLKHIKIATIIISTIEIIAIAAFSTLYFTNAFHIKDNIKEPSYVFLGLVILVFLNIIFVWSIENAIGNLRRKLDLKTSDLVGGDIKQAYTHADLGLLVTDQDDTIIWANDYFLSRGISEKIDENIGEAIPETKQLLENPNLTTDIEVKIGEHTYSVKYLHEAGLWMFKDISDLKFLNEKYTNEKPVIGVLSIDNYDEVVRAGDDFNDALNKVKTALDEYTTKFGILLRKLNEKKYSMFFNLECLEKIKQDEFSILKTVKKVSGSESMPLTISIGIAYEYPDVIKLNDLANDALELAMARGGDQIVLNNYTGSIEYFGGNTENKGSISSIKYRTIGNTLVELIQKSTNVVIMGHTQTDMDALGACLGIKAICDRVANSCKIVIDYSAIENKTQEAIYHAFGNQRDNIFVSPKTALELIHPSTLLVVVDTSNPTITVAPELLDKATKIVVIDHHRRNPNSISEHVILNEIDTSASSTCEIITEFIEYIALNPRVELPNNIATIMLSGIYMDTQYFKSAHTGFRTFEASSILQKNNADNNLAISYLKDDIAEFKLINEILGKIDHQRQNVAIICVDEPDKLDPKERMTLEDSVISKIADRCLELKDIHASFVIAPLDDKSIKLSARSDNKINVEIIVNALGGGGHRSAAAARFDKESIKDVRQRLLNVLDKKLTEATLNFDKDEEE